MNTKQNRTMTIGLGSIIAAVVLVAMLGTAADAQGPTGPGGWRHGAGSGLMLGIPLRSLNLTPEQHTQIHSVLSTYRSSARPIFQQLRQAQTALTDKLLAPGQIQAADLQGPLQQIGQLRGQLLQLSAQATLDIRNLLTPEQLASAAQTKEKLRDLRSQMHQLLDPAGQP